MASFVLSFCIALIVSLLVCQMATSSRLKRRVRSDSETTTMSSENGNEEEVTSENSLNDNQDNNGMAGTMKNSKESDVELVSRIFDTSPLTLTKFMTANSNFNETNRFVNAITDASNSHTKIRKIEESRMQDASVSDKDVTKDVKRNESNENYDDGRRCAEHKRDGKDCNDFCKMTALKNIPTNQNVSNISEHGARSIRNSSKGITSLNDTDNKFFEILKESDDTARMTMKDFEQLNRMEIAARLFEDSTPMKAQNDSEEVEMKDDEHLEHPIQPITMSFYKKLIPYITDLPEVMEFTEVTTADGSDLLHEKIESDTVTSNAEKLVTSKSENKDLTQHGESFDSAATLKFADPDKVNETLKNSLGTAINFSRDKSNSQDVRASQVPQTRLYAYNKKKNEDGDAREIEKYLKKANERWINIIINNYPPHVCNKEKM